MKFNLVDFYEIEYMLESMERFVSQMNCEVGYFAEYLETEYGQQLKDMESSAE